MSGVRVEWIDGEKANRLKIVAPYTIVIVPEPLAPVKAQAEHLGTDVMGQAAPVVGRAYIYYDRILRILTPSHDIVTTLGDVMAHELGHLVLPIGHSLVGIMRPTVNMRSRRVETFTEVEAGEIHARLRERTNIEPRTPNREPNLNTN